MAKLAVRLQVIQAAMFVGLVALIGRAAQVQLVQGRRWATEAEVRRRAHSVLGARRGALLDRYGTPLALTKETYHVGLAPNELRDPERDAATVARQLHLPLDDVRRALVRRYAYFAGPFSAIQVQPLRAVRGVHLEAVVNRFYPRPELAHAVIGPVGGEGRGAPGPQLAPCNRPAARP